MTIARQLLELRAELNKLAPPEMEALEVVIEVHYVRGRMTNEAVPEEEWWPQRAQPALAQVLEAQKQGRAIRYRVVYLNNDDGSKR